MSVHVVVVVLVIVMVLVGSWSGQNLLTNRYITLRLRHHRIYALLRYQVLYVLEVICVLCDSDLVLSVHLHESNVVMRSGCGALRTLLEREALVLSLDTWHK